MVRVNKDLLREMLFFDYDPENEGWVKWIETEIARIMLHKGFAVVVDDTNLKPVDIVNWQTFAEVHGIENISIRHIETDVEVCVDRDSRRENSVGAERIREMAGEHVE